MRKLLAASLLLLAAAPAHAQSGKLWERSKLLTCTASTAHSCTEQTCTTEQITAQIRLDLGAMSGCLVRGVECVEAEVIATTKVVEGAFFVYLGQDKSDPTIFRILEDGRFSAVGLRKISEEGGYTILGTCAGQ